MTEEEVEVEESAPVEDVDFAERINDPLTETVEDAVDEEADAALN